MSRAALIVGSLILAQGVVGLLQPWLFLRAIAAIQTPPVIYVAAAVRIAIGIVLVLGASESRLPRLLKGFGILVTIGGLLTPLLGVRFSRVVLGWWSAGGSSVIRGWAVAALVLGAFVTYAAWPSQRRAA